MRARRPDRVKWLPSSPRFGRLRYLLATETTVSARLLRRLVALFDRAAVLGAFRLGAKAGHRGFTLLRPAARATAPAAPVRFFTEILQKGAAAVAGERKRKAARG